MLSLEQDLWDALSFASLIRTQIFTVFNSSTDKIKSLRRSLEQLVWLINIFRIFTFTLEMFLTTNFNIPSSQERNECHCVQGKTCHLISLSFSCRTDPKAITGTGPNAQQSISRSERMTLPDKTFNPQTKTLIMLCWPITPEVRFHRASGIFMHPPIVWYSILLIKTINCHHIKEAFPVPLVIIYLPPPERRTASFVQHKSLWQQLGRNYLSSELDIDRKRRERERGRVGFAVH